MRLNIHLHSNASMFVYGLINTVETVFSAKLGPGSLRHSFVTTGGNKLKGASRSKSCVSIDCARPILLRVPGQGEGCSGLPRWRGARTIHPSRQSRGSGGGRRIIPPHTHFSPPGPQPSAGGGNPPAAPEETRQPQPAPAAAGDTPTAQAPAAAAVGRRVRSLPCPRAPPSPCPRALLRDVAEEEAAVSDAADSP